MIKEAPIYYPSAEEFKQGPISYIAKIRNEAEKYGICKIVPPDTFTPPFVVDENCFEFTPRYQRLNELEASIRTKLNYTEFGFTLSHKRYSLSEFTRMANEFKQNYFKTQQHTKVPLDEVEREYWRLVTSLHDSVGVEYGADLHCNEFGSGFPTKSTRDLLSDADHKYIDHPWNLNNTPVAEGSVFKYINANISGMIIPWMYVGMCFSTFCWHNEDHWTYSISYLHNGEPKTWYGVPGTQAEIFERSMKRVAPNLFESQPDLLHQLVTICNPYTLIDDKVPIHKVYQYAGEFVVTFPRAYHTGFNQGFNFAEAVNFAPSDWLKIGRNCIDHYSQLRRYPVFSHDELVCKMANDPSPLNHKISLAAYQDMYHMLKSEKVLRSNVLDWGVTRSARHKFEMYPDDERQCFHCRTTCFLSALTCACDTEFNTSDQRSTTNGDQSSDSSNLSQQPNQKRIVCLSHKHKLCFRCEPHQHILLYRYTLNELPILQQRLLKRIMHFERESNSDYPSLKKVARNGVSVNGNRSIDKI